MYKLGEIMSRGGKLLLIISGFCTLLNLVEKNVFMISLLVMLSLIFIGAGSSIKKNYNKS